MSELRSLVQTVVREELARAREIPQPDRENEYLTTSQAANFSRTTPATVRRWIQEGRLESHTTGRRLLVRRVDLLALVRPGRRVANRRKVATPEIAPEILAARALAKI